MGHIVQAEQDAVAGKLQNCTLISSLSDRGQPADKLDIARDKCRLLQELASTARTVRISMIYGCQAYASVHVQERSRQASRWTISQSKTSLDISCWRLCET